MTLNLKYLVTSAFIFLVAKASLGEGNYPATADTQVSLGSRIFELSEWSPIIDRQVEKDFVSLSAVEWIWNLTRLDSDLVGTVIHIKDHTRLYSVGRPVWAPDVMSRFHPDPTLPPIFDLDYYAVGWQGALEAPIRGTLLLFPKHNPQLFYASCAYDRSEIAPTFCAVNFRYGPDENLIIKTRMYKVTTPLNDFAEVAAKVDALVRCLDITDAKRINESITETSKITPADIAAGGACRKLLSG